MNKFVSVVLLSLLLAGLIGNFLLPSVKGISGYEVSLPFYGLEELPIPDDFNTTDYMQVIETSNQLWIAGAGTNASDHYRGGIWNYTDGTWVKFRNSSSNAGKDNHAHSGYRTWTMFNDTHHFFDEAGAVIIAEGWKCGRLFTNDTGKHFYETNEGSLLGKAVYKSPINETFFLMHWGDDCVWKSANLMDWTVYKNITQWVLDRGVGKDPIKQPHATIGVSQNFHRLYVNYETYLDYSGGTNYEPIHTTIYQNLDTGEWHWLNWTANNQNFPPVDFRVGHAGTTFCTMTETSKVVVLGDTDRDASELKFVNVTKDDRRYLVDAIQGMNIRRGSTEVAQGPQLASKNDVIYVTYDAVAVDTYQPQIRYGIRISPDHGVTWGTLLERRALNPADGEHRLFWLWQGARHLFIFDDDTKKLYRMACLTQDEAWAVVNYGYVSRSGSTVTFEKTLSNQTTDAVDLSQYGEVSTANVTLIGASYFNKQKNSGFEWGNKTGYAGDHINYLNIINNASEAYEGNYYGNLTAPYDGWKYIETEKIPWTCGLNAKGVVASVYLKYKQWNESEPLPDKLFSVYEHNSTSDAKFAPKTEVHYSIGTTWQRVNITIAGHIVKGYDNIFVRIRCNMKKNDTLLMDAFMVEECDPDIQGMPPTEEKKWNVYVQGDYFTSELKTQNPSVTINGQTFSYSGTLNNGQETSAESIILPKTGIVHINSINVEGSGLVKIKIQATVRVIAESIFLREYTNSIYIGHYYNNSYTFIGDNSNIVIFCKPFANITSASLSVDKLTFTVSAENGRTSTTKVYCGSKGEPTAVSGADSWSYDSTTKICMITVTHSSVKEVVVSWATSDNPPTLGTQGYSTTTAGEPCRFYSKWKDDDSLSDCIFGTNLTGSWQNETHTLTSNPDWCNVTKTLPSRGGVRVEYQFWVNDSADQWATSNLRYFTTTSVGVPTYNDIGYNTTLAGNIAEFSCYWQDPDGLSHFIFSWNGTGIWTNDTASALTGTADWANLTKTLPSNVGVVVGFRWYCNDTGDNWGDTGIQTLTKTETTVWCWFQFGFKDLGNNDVESKIIWALYNGSQALSYKEGEAALLAGTYTLKTCYHSKLINETSLSTETYGNTTVNIYLMMKAYVYGYIAFNNTVTSITINSQTSNNLTFTVEGSSPQMIIVDVLQNASRIRRNGVKQTDWAYNDASKYIEIDAAALSVWQLTFEGLGEPYFTEALIIATVVAVGSGAVLAFVYRRKKKSVSVPCQAITKLNQDCWKKLMRLTKKEEIQ